MERISDLLLERYNLGEVTRKERRLVERSLVLDASLNERLERINAHAKTQRRKVFYFPYSLRAFAPLRENYKYILSAAVLLFAIGLPITIFSTHHSAPAIQEIAGERVKGTGISGPELRLFVQGGTTAADNSSLHAGDTVQLAYAAPGGKDCYGVIFSLDGNGVETLHFPATEDSSTKLETGRQVFLSESYTLDDAPEFEDFYFITSDAPIDIKNISNCRKLIEQEGYEVAFLHVNKK
ncbi:MAG: hypothetical protein LBM77_07995 [Spirochaetaceae bacterium]|jgi:hypothetical protein|nr:hypothetical protein [Spirochaetaceae bacterium]